MTDLTTRTLEEKKAWLRSYGALCRELERTQEELRHWQSFSGQLLMEQPCPLALRQLAEHLEEQLRQLYRQRLEIEKSIADLESPAQRELLTLRYLQGCTLEHCAKRLHYSRRQCTRLQREALKALRPKDGPLCP